MAESWILYWVFWAAADPNQIRRTWTCQGVTTFR